MFRSLRSLLDFGTNKKSTRKTNTFFKNVKMSFDTLEERTVPASFTPGDIVALRVGMTRVRFSPPCSCQRC